MTANKKLEVKDLVIKFKTDNGLVQAVRDISFDLYEGETLCIVGESGSGKSVTSKAIMGILANNAIVESGSIIYEGENLLDVSEDEFHKIRGRKIGMIFQDPLSSLNPIMRIGKQITEATLVNADKIKMRYNELISKENLAYKNAIAHTKIVIKKAKDDYEQEVAKVQKALAENKNKDFKQKKLAELKAKKAELDNFIKDEKIKLKALLPPLKLSLEERKKTAKVEIKEYEANLKQNYVKKQAEVKQKYENTIKELEQKLVLASENSEETNKINEEIQGLLKEYKIELDKVKQEYIDSTRITKAEAKRRALEIMKEVGIPYPERRFKQYPFEFSGGMRQRIVIAIALTASPDVLICDEPTTALDVTIQAQILELINKLKVDRGLSCIFITHDLGVVANMADRVAVMYAGKIVEYGKSNEIFFEPRHPYTWALLSSIPDIDSKERLEAIPGTPPDMIYPPKGDAFALRSKYAMEVDYKYEPPFFKVSETHYAATWLLHPDAPKVEMPKIVSERIRIALAENQKKQELADKSENVAAHMQSNTDSSEVVVEKDVKEESSDEQ